MQFSIRIAAFFLVALFAASCNNNQTVPFPEEELGFAPPETVPLVFSKTQKLTWDTLQAGGIKPAISKFNMEALPALPLDTSGFKPFKQAPKTSVFNYNSLPDTSFSLAKLVNKPLEFVTTALPPPVSVKSFRPGAQRAVGISLFDLGPVHGLPAKFIGAVFKDSKGVLWIGGTEGLFRYDGQYVQTVLTGENTIPIVGITEDKNGNIWSVSAEGITSVNIKQGTVSRSAKINSVSNNLGKMMLDSDGNIWVYNVNDAAVSIIDPTKATYKNLDFKHGLADSLAYEMVQDINKKIWISTYSSGADIIDLQTGTIKYLTTLNGLASNDISALHAAKNGEVLIGNKSGFDIIDLKNGIIKHYNQEQGLDKHYPLGFTIDGKGQIWRYTNGGMEVVNVVKGETRKIISKANPAENIVANVTEDAFKRIWIGSTGGLKMIEQYAKTTQFFSNLNVISLMEDALGNLWVATSNQGVIILNAQRTAMRILNQSNGLSNNFVQSFTKSNGSMIVATSGGYNVIDPVRKTLLKMGKSQGFPKDTIYSVFRDKAANTWFLGPEKGIALFDSSKNIVIHTDKAQGLSADGVIDMRQDNDGKYWLVTSSGGVNVIDKAAGLVSYLDNEPGLKETSNKTILVDADGRIWMGTYNGIYIADTKAKTLTHITTKQGLSHNKILSLLEYKGSVYAGTNHKITIIRAPRANSKTDTSWKISILKSSEGLIKTQSSWLSDCITSNGAYLWGDAGITVLHNIEPTADSPATFIAGISIMNQPQNFAGSSTDTANGAMYANKNIYKWDSVTGSYNLPVNLVIPHQKNYLQFQYGQANLGRQDTTWFVYLLQGIDKAWSAPTINISTENYLNLPSGAYTFKVSSKYASGKWSTPASFSFVISPPWYQTWWAYTFYILLAAAVLRGYIFYRSRKLQKENKILEEKVTLRTEQLQKSLEELKATQTQLVQAEKMASLGELTAGIAHEIQNPLNFINNFSEVNVELLAEMKEEILKGNTNEVMALAADISSNHSNISNSRIEIGFNSWADRFVVCR